MAKDTEKLIRQLSLISYLMAERRPVTALEIRRDVEGYSGMNEDAFARRFYADRAELESLGIVLAVDHPVDGMAERVGDRITVKLKAPVAKTFELDGKIVFPTEQIQHIIAAAREGKSVLELMVYDGSDNGEKVYNTLSVIGQPIPGTRDIASPDPSTANDQMKTLTRWPVTVSYYDRDAKTKEGEQTPVYAMSFELFENGVSRALVLDYNDFVIAGAMGRFDVRDSKPCK